MSGDTELQRIARIIAISEGNILRFIEAKFHHLKEHFLTPLEQAIADADTRVQNLATEVQNANTKIDKLIALAAAAGVPQADIDAITALGTKADAATASLQAEEAKIDAADGDAPAAGTSTQPAAGSDTPTA